MSIPQIGSLVTVSDVDIFSLLSLFRDRSGLNESLPDTESLIGAFDRSLSTLFATRERANRINVLRDHNRLIVHLIGVLRLSPLDR